MQTLKIALIGEGKNDVGISDSFGGWNEGAVQPIVRKFIPNAEFQVLEAKKDPKSFKTPGKNTPQFSGAMRKIRALWPELIQQGDNFDLLIFYHDLDKRESGKATEISAKKTFREAKENAESASAQLHERLQLPLAAMIPMRMLENWLLADENAFKEAFGDHPKNPKLPNKPEFTWGDEQNPSSDHPKRYLHRVFEQFGESAATENFVIVANAASKETLRKKCPISFAPFAEEIENFIAKRA